MGDQAEEKLGRIVRPFQEKMKHAWAEMTKRNGVLAWAENGEEDTDASSYAGMLKARQEDQLVNQVGAEEIALLKRELEHE